MNIALRIVFLIIALVIGNIIARFDLFLLDGFFGKSTGNRKIGIIVGNVFGFALLVYILFFHYR